MRQGDRTRWAWQHVPMLAHPPCSSVLLSLLLVALASACGAPSARGPSGTASAEAPRRVVLGRLVIDRASAGTEVSTGADASAAASSWANGGLFSGAELVVGPHLEVRDGTPVLEDDAPTPRSFLTLGADGGEIRFGAERGPVYVKGLRVAKQLVVLETESVFPILVRVPAAPGACQYVGTIHLRRHEGVTEANVADDYDREARALAGPVRGCQGLAPTKALAEVLDVVNGELVAKRVAPSSLTLPPR